MDEKPLKLKTCPIVEAVVDIRCDLPASFKLEELETEARVKYHELYPKYQKQLVEKHTMEAEAGKPAQVSTQQGLQAFQFLTADQRQLVQIRPQGYSFNRLAPYTTLDEYLPHIERSWQIFVGLVSPVLVREIRLRFINRLLLPLTYGRVEVNDYLKVGPRLPDEKNLVLRGFLDQHTAQEESTGHLVNLILTMQNGYFTDYLPVILDIEVISGERIAPTDWPSIHSKIESLRLLKNRMFQNTVTGKCLSLYS